MTLKEAIAEYGELDEWEKEPGHKMSWSGEKGAFGAILFSFDDGKTVYNVYGIQKEKITKEESEIFWRENPTLARLFQGHPED